MRANKSSGTAPELAIARELRRLGIPFETNVTGLPGTPDFVLRRGSTAVAAFLHGCFWHGCRAHYKAPKSNAVYWRRKVEANREHDVDVRTRLERLGYVVVVAWEHERPRISASRIAHALRCERFQRPQQTFRPPRRFSARRRGET